MLSSNITGSHLAQDILLSNTLLNTPPVLSDVTQTHLCSCYVSVHFQEKSKHQFTRRAGGLKTHSHLSMKQQQHQERPIGVEIGKKPICNQVSSHSPARTPPFCFPDPLPVLAAYQDLDTWTDTGFPLMQQLPDKLYNKLELLYDSDNTIV